MTVYTQLPLHTQVTPKYPVITWVTVVRWFGFAAKVFFFVREADYVTIAQRFSAGRSRKTVESP